MPRLLSLPALVASVLALGIARGCWYYLYLEPPETYYERICACGCEALIANEDENAFSCCYPLASTASVPAVCSSLSSSNCAATPTLASYCAAVTVGTTDLTYSTSAQYTYTYPSWTPSVTTVTSYVVATSTAVGTDSGTTSYNAPTDVTASGTVTSWVTETVTSTTDCASSSPATSTECDSSTSAPPVQTSSAPATSVSEDCGLCGHGSEVSTTPESSTSSQPQETTSSAEATTATDSTSCESDTETSTSTSTSTSTQPPSSKPPKTSSAAATVTSSTVAVGNTPPPGYSGGYKRALATLASADEGVAKRGGQNNGGRIGVQMPPPGGDGDGARKRGVTHTVTAIETVTAASTGGDLAGRALDARETPSSTCTSTTTTTTYVCAQETTSQNEATAVSSAPPTSASEVESTSCADTSTSAAEVGETPPSGYTGGYKRAAKTGSL